MIYNTHPTRLVYLPPIPVDPHNMPHQNTNATQVPLLDQEEAGTSLEQYSRRLQERDARLTEKKKAKPKKTQPKAKPKAKPTVKQATKAVDQCQENLLKMADGFATKAAFEATLKLKKLSECILAATDVGVPTEEIAAAADECDQKAALNALIVAIECPPVTEVEKNRAKEELDRALTELADAEKDAAIVDQAEQAIVEEIVILLAPCLEKYTALRNAATFRKLTKVATPHLIEKGKGIIVADPTLCSPVVLFDLSAAYRSQSPFQMQTYDPLL